MLAAMATVCAEKLPPGLRKYRIGAAGVGDREGGTDGVGLARTATGRAALGRCSTSAWAGGTPLPPSMSTRTAKPSTHSRRAIDELPWCGTDRDMAPSGDPTAGVPIPAAAVPPSGVSWRRDFLPSLGDWP